MDRVKYNTCLADGMRGKKFTAEERKLEFCTLAKLCSGKVGSREEAIAICSQPKEPKAPRTKRGKKNGIEPGAMAVCVFNSLDGSEVTVDSLTAILSKCTGQKPQKVLTREKFIKKCFKENAVTGDIKEAQKLRSMCTVQWKEREAAGEAG